TATYMEMHSKGPMPSKHRVDWTQYDARTATRIPLPNIKNLLQNPAYGLLLQCFLPEMRKRYHSRDDQIQLYLLVPDTAVLVQDDELLVAGEESVERQIQQSLDLYFHLGQPQIKDYQVTFQERQAIIAVGDRSFQLPLPFSYSP
ncbi:MAG TPA: hypothetical protein VFQ30_21340, partial [Ktedonobacteraceae bacterium]|nr:hypothetical protein [Ktedonobacteraceae bacterium]